MRAHIHSRTPRKLLRQPARAIIIRAAARAAIILAALAACADDTRLPTASRAPNGGAAALGSLRDNGIDRSDSHFAVRVVTTTEHSSGVGDVGDVGIASLSLEPPATSTEVHIEAGYGTSGEARFGVWFDDRNEFPDISSIRSVGDIVNIYDQHGSLKDGLVFADFMAALGLPGGTLNGAFFPTVPPDGDPCSLNPDACSPAAQGGVLGARVTTEDVGDVRIVRTELEPSGLGTMSGTERVSMAHHYRRVANGNGQGTANTGGVNSGVEAATGSREVWRLDQIVSERRSNGRVTRTKQQMYYSRWHRHAPRDATRESAASAARAAAAAERAALPIAAPQVEQTPVATSLDRSAEDAPVPTLGAAGLLGSTICPRGTTQFDEMVGGKGATGNWLLFQHGFCATAATWSGMRLVAPAEFSIARQRAYSTTSYERIDTQVDELVQSLEPRPTQGHVVIGHSAGGIVGRRLGQRYPAQVQGVVTVGTPHLGSITAEIGGDIAGDVLVNVASSPCYVVLLCELFAEVLAEHVGGTLLGGIINATAPAIGDLRPGSPFLTELNSTPEHFARVSIAVTIPERWAIARMLGDSRSPRERLANGSRPRGDARVTDVRNFYASVNWARYVSAFLLWHVSQVSPGANCNRFGYDLTWPACTDPQSAYYWHQQWFQSILLLIVYEISGRIMWLMDVVDWAWHRVTKGDRRDSDGFIDTPSQRYPASPGLHPPLRLSVIGQYADSHAGQTASPQIVNVLREAVAQIGQRSIR